MRLPAISLVAVVLLGACGDGADTPSRFLRGPTRRARCTDRDPLRLPRFGDLHVHTRLSFDAAVARVRNTPDDAYRFAKGEAVGLPPYDATGTPERTVRLSRPLDFAAVTDHSEFLAEVSICQDPSALTYDSSSCQNYRQALDSMVFNSSDFLLALASTPPERRDTCLDPYDGYCMDRLATIWADAVAVTEAHDDRSSDCGFATLIAYEWTGTVRGNNWHRNVIFGTSTVPARPTSFIEAYSPEMLWDALHAGCIDAGVGCDVLAIPHNLNISGGIMFETVDDADQPYTAALAERRRTMEPLVELYQHKGASECTPGLGPLASPDEACRFELLVPNVCTGAPTDPPNCIGLCTTNVGGGFLGGCVSPQDFGRSALRTGLAQWSALGSNPFEFGFIGSTDTHNGTPGNTAESTFRGHVGVQDDEPRDLLARPSGSLIASKYSSPGGLAVVWSEENSRPSIFDGLRRRETYATSGTRIVLRFFGGAGLPSDACTNGNLAQTGYASGVPMGGTLPPSTTAPTFVVQAAKDAESADLQHLEIVKAWFDGTTTHEQVFVVAGDPSNGASVDVATCTPTGAGAGSLCTAWTDPTFDATQPALYYARVFENPTCRWNRYLCNQLAVDCGTVVAGTPEASCCDGSIPDTQSERAWSSPIWYYPQR